MADNELGLMLRVQRESVQPAEVGLPAGPRRRALGLRRSEVAMLAGVSVEYLTRLEQGRDRRPSPEVVSALATALQMTSRQRIRLYQLTKADSGFQCVEQWRVVRDVRPELRTILQMLEPASAVIVNRLTEVLAYTPTFRALTEPAGLFDDGEPPCLARYVFTDPRARELYLDWDAAADKLVASLKEGPFRADSHIAGLVDELTVTGGAEFTRRIEQLPGLAATSGVGRMGHPRVGEFRLRFEMLSVPAEEDQHLIVHIPADDAAAAAMDRLAGRRAGGLRAV